MKFEITNPDFQISPCTGMTRQHWLEISHLFQQVI